jgi:hypothetical protein
MNEMEYIKKLFQEISQEVKNHCKAACMEVADRYPIDVFPEAGESIVCHGAKMARLTVSNCIRAIDELEL